MSSLPIEGGRDVQSHIKSFMALKRLRKTLNAKMIESKMRGHARVTFRAHIALIRTELEQGHTAKSIYERHKTKLGSMSYRQLLRHIGREITGLSSVPPAPEVATTPPPLTSSKPIPATETSPHARHEPTAKRTFVHDGRTKEGEAERLFGPGYLPGSRK